jgi:hypothetical protein
MKGRRLKIGRDAIRPAVRATAVGLCPGLCPISVNLKVAKIRRSEYD